MPKGCAQLVDFLLSQIQQTCETLPTGGWIRLHEAAAAWENPSVFHEVSHNYSWEFYTRHFAFLPLLASSFTHHPQGLLLLPTVKLKG